MKNFILDKNFVQEVEEIDKKHKTAIFYNGRDLEGEKIKIVDLEANKIAPIVRFLAEWKKRKLSWILIAIAGLLLFIFFWLMVYVLYPDKAPPPTPIPAKPTPTQVVKPKPDIEVVKTEKENETSWSLELFNEVDMMTDLKNNAELETIQRNYEIERLKVDLVEEQKENEKLTNMVNNLENELTLLKTRKTESATDEFIYYLWDSFYDRCKQPTTDMMIENCKTLYFNFLEYGKNR